MEITMFTKTIHRRKFRLLLLLFIPVLVCLFRIYGMTKQTSKIHKKLISTKRLWPTNTVKHHHHHHQQQQHQEATKKRNRTFVPISTSDHHDGAFLNRSTIDQEYTARRRRRKQTCLEWENSSTALIAALHDDADDPEMATSALAYKDWYFPEMINTTTTTTTNMIRQTFIKRRTIFIGDSTLFYPKETLLRLVIDAQKMQQEEEKMMTTTTSSSSFLPPRQQRIIYDPDTTVQWLGFRGINIEMNCDWDHIWDLVLSTSTLRPDIMIVNWGFHMLHAFELGRGGTPDNDIIRLCHVDQWIHYEDQFLKRAIQVARNTQTTKLLLFKTNNLLCGEKNDNLRLAAEKVKTRDVGFFRACMNALEKQLVEQPKILLYPDTLEKLKSQDNPKNYEQPKIHLTREEMEDYCWNGAFEEGGSRRLNDRMVRFLNDNATKKMIPDNLTVAIYNDHDLESCQYTVQGDGRHYQQLNPLRIRLLAHEIDCLYPKEKAATLI